MLANAGGSRVLLINIARGALDDDAEATMLRSDTISLLMRGLALLGVPAFAAGESQNHLGSAVAPAGVLHLGVDPLTIWRQDGFSSQLSDPAVGIVYLAGAWLEEDLVLAAIEGGELGYDVRLLADLSIPRIPAERDIALRRLEQHGVILTSVRQTLLEWALAIDDENLRAAVRSLL
jgi:hypothetical protein